MSENIVCRSCRSKDVIEDPDTGERICAGCGVVIDESALERGPEWRAFTSQERENMQRTGPPISNVYYDQGLSTTFDPRDTRGTSEDQQRMWRLKRRDTRTKLTETGLRNLKIALIEMERLIDALHLPRGIKEQAIEIYKQTLKKDLIRGQTIDGFVAASIYAACRQAKIPRSLKEVAELSTQEIKTISRIYRQILQELDIRMPIVDGIKATEEIIPLFTLNKSMDKVFFA